jgi:glycosyltransferase involved in cell wall biosynthesis
MDSSPFFTVVMPSFLGHYPTAAKLRDEKIHRAIHSVISQSFTNWQLIVISDGCDKTFDIVKENYFSDIRIDCYKIRKEPLWSGTPRNFGIALAKGEYICYLDIDDYFGQDHLSIIKNGIDNAKQKDWVWFDDYEGSKHGKFTHKKRDIHKRSNHGTCNICHKKDLAQWSSRATYLHDFEFVQSLKKKSLEFEKIDTPQYYICHVPNKFDI